MAKAQKDADEAAGSDVNEPDDEDDEDLAEDLDEDSDIEELNKKGGYNGDGNCVTRVLAHLWYLGFKIGVTCGDICWLGVGIISPVHYINLRPDHFPGLQ